MPKQSAKKGKVTRKQKLAAADEQSKKTNATATKINDAIEYQETPVKSDCDDNEYRALKLSNGLRVVLVSNPSVPEEEKHNPAAKNEFADKTFGRDVNNMHMLPGRSSFTMSMDVGSFSDPPEVPCVSTILGHVVLKASQNYPQPNGLLEFLVKNKGGLIISANNSERTTFHVYISESHFGEAIERFVDCFVAPLLRVADVDKERKRILQEVQTIINIAEFAGIEMNGKQYLLDTIASSIPGHPGSNLGPGYENKLNFLSEQRILEEVEKFMKRHYSAHRMSVVVEGRLPLDTLETYAKTYFSKIPNNGLPRADYTNFRFSQCFNTPEFRMMYQMSSYCNSVFMCDYELELNWTIPSSHKLYRSKPQQYVAWIMNYKGKGSLRSYLKSRGWCKNMECGINKSKHEGNSVFNLFNVSIILTDEGHENRKQVLDAIFSYINLIRREGPQKRIYDEIRKLEEAIFRFEPNNMLTRTVAPLHDVMVIASPVDYLRGGPLYLEYSPILIKQCLDLLAPEKANIIVFDRDFYDRASVPQDWEEEDGDSVHYRRKFIPEEWIDYWKNIEPLPEFYLPIVNDFIGDDYELVQPPENPPQHPIIIHSDDKSRIWYKLDVKFLRRQNFLNYFFRSSLPTESPENCFMMDLFAELLFTLTLEELYPAMVAGLSYRIVSYNSRLLVKVSGISKKIVMLTKEITRHAANLENIATEDMFETTKETLLAKYWSQITSPLLLARDARLSIVRSGYPLYNDMYSAAANVDFAKFKDFTKLFSEHIHVDCLAQGNLTKTEVIENVRECIEILKCGIALPNSIPRFAIKEIPRGTQFCRFKTIAPDFNDTFVLNYYQFSDQSLRNSVMIEFFFFCLVNDQFASHKAHEDLYKIGVTLGRDDSDDYGYFLQVGSFEEAAFETMTTIEKKIEKFRATARKLFQNLSEKEWERLKKGFIRSLEVQDASLEKEVLRNVDEVASERFAFDKAERELAIFKKFAIEDLREGTMNLMTSGPGLRKLSVQAIGKRAPINLQRMGPSRIGRYQNLRSNYTTAKLEFLTNLPKEEEKPLDCFITDIGRYNRGLKVLPLLDLGAMDDIAEAIRRDCNV